eukprot:g54602.t1
MRGVLARSARCFQAQAHQRSFHQFRYNAVPQKFLKRSLTRSSILHQAQPHAEPAEAKAPEEERELTEEERAKQWEAEKDELWKESNLYVVLGLKDKNAPKKEIHPPYPELIKDVEAPHAKTITINWMDTEGRLTKMQHEVGISLLDAAQEADMDLPAVCNGFGGDPRDYEEGPYCKYCHVYVASSYLPKLDVHSPPSREEDTMLYWVENSTANSRLACMIQLEESMDGMTVAIPEFPTWDDGDPAFSTEEFRYLHPHDQQIDIEIDFQEKEEAEWLEDGMEDPGRVITAEEFVKLDQRSSMPACFFKQFTGLSVIIWCVPPVLAWCMVHRDYLVPCGCFTHGSDFLSVLIGPGAGGFSAQSASTPRFPPS